MAHLPDDRQWLTHRIERSELGKADIIPDSRDPRGNYSVLIEGNIFVVIYSVCSERMVRLFTGRQRHITKRAIFGMSAVYYTQNSFT